MLNTEATEGRQSVLSIRGKERTLLAAAALLGALAAAGCNHQPMVQFVTDEETGDEIVCQGLDFGGNQLPQGLWQCVWPAGKLHSVGYYDAGKRVGEWIYYTVDGKVRLREQYRDGAVYSSEWGEGATDGEDAFVAESLKE